MRRIYSRKQKLIAVALIALVLLETWIQGSFAKTHSDWLPLVYFFSGIGIAIIPLICKEPPNIQASRLSQWKARTFILVSAAVFLLFAVQTFHAHPIDYRESDVLPAIQILTRRFIDGDPIYVVMTELWGGSKPVYLPAMWLPFVTSTYFNFDPRWVTMVFLVTAVLGAYRVWRPNPGLKFTVFLFTPAVIFFILLIVRESRLIIYSQEGVVIAYYVFLAYAILYKKPYLVGAMAGLCILSRYGIIFWLFAYLLYLIATRQFEMILKASVAGLVVILILMIPTESFGYLNVFLGLDDIYLNAVRPNNEWKMSDTLYRGLGLVRFWEYDNLRGFHRLFLALNITVPIVAFGLIWKKPKSYTNLAPLCILKLSMVFFYNFIIIPVSTLFFVSNMLSLVVLYAWFHPPVLKNVSERHSVHKESA